MNEVPLRIALFAFLLPGVGGCRAPCPRVRSLAAHIKARCISPVPPSVPALLVPSRTCDGPARFALELPRLGSTGPLRMLHVQLRGGASAYVPLAKRDTVFGVVLAGPVTLALGGAPTSPRSPTSRVLQAWEAFRIPHGHFDMTMSTPLDRPPPDRSPPDGASARVLLIAVTADGRALEPGDRAVAPVDLAALPDLTWGNGAFRARIALQAPDSPEASLGALVARKDATIPLHVHEREWEHVIVLSGGGTFLTPTQQPATRTVRAGDVIHVPPGVRHGFQGNGREDLVGLQLYTPPGPEQRFRKLAHPHAP